jgi:RNA polymerase sigma factor for flagellar operon FliA
MLARRYPEQDGPAPERLVASHMDLVRKIAWHMHGRVGRLAEIEDMLQVGYMGLVDASQRYTPRQGATFAAYAAIRIRGSIIDFLRASSSLCRATIVMQQKMRAAVNRLEQHLMRAPEKAEIATEMGITMAELEGWETQFGASQIRSLDEVYTDHSMLFSDSNRSVEDKLMYDQMRGMLRRALERLPEREALVLQLYFVEELNVYEIADILGVTTGRVSQIKKSAVTRLRELIAQMEET